MTGQIVQTLTAGGKQRTLTVLGPSTRTAPAPMVLVFHGSNQDGAALRRLTGGAFDRFATERGAVVAYLDGHRRHWNDARRSPGFAAREEGFDDVAFAVATIELLSGRYGGDPASVYAVGYSNGGQMVFRLIHELGTVLAGAAVISATQPAEENFAPAVDERKPLPLVLVHGTKDPLVPYDGGMASLWGFRPRGMGLSAADTAAYYARRNRLPEQPANRTVVSGTAGQKHYVERVDYRASGRQPVTIFTVHGGGHTIPGTRKAPFLLGHTDLHFDSVGAIADFWALGERNAFAEQSGAETPDGSD